MQNLIICSNGSPISSLLFSRHQQFAHQQNLCTRSFWNIRKNVAEAFNEDNSCPNSTYKHSLLISYTKKEYSNPAKWALFEVLNRNNDRSEAFIQKLRGHDAAYKRCAWRQFGNHTKH